MDDFGCLSLGASAALLSGLIVNSASRTSSLGAILAAILPVVLSAAAVFLLPFLATVRGASFYSIGLLLSLLWQRTGAIIAAYEEAKTLKWLGRVLSFLLLILTAFLLFNARG